MNPMHCAASCVKWPEYQRPPSGSPKALYWASLGAVAGVIVVLGVYAIDKVIDDPVGALSAHGLAGIWGTLSCGLFTSPRLADLNAVTTPSACAPSCSKEPV